jgi:hypothetical protein
MNHACDLCNDEGISMHIDGKRKVARFCTCAIGRRRQLAYTAYQERVKATGRLRQGKRERTDRRMVKDYKSEAAGNGERWPGEEG